MKKTNTPEYNRQYYLTHKVTQTKRRRIRAELEQALQCLTDFSSGSSLSRDQAIVHIRHALTLVGEVASAGR